MSTTIENANVLGMIAAGLGGPESPVGRLGTQLQRGTAAQLRAEEEERRREEEEAGMWGQIGSTLGGLGGVLAAPFTAGTSLAATAGMGAAGSALGGTVGQAAAGGDVTGQEALGYGLQGGVSGALTHFAPQMGNLMGGQQAAGTAPGQAAAEAHPGPILSPAGQSTARAPGLPQGALGAASGAASAPTPQSLIGDQLGPQFQNWMQGQMLGQQMGITPSLTDPNVRTRVPMRYDPYNDTWRAGHAYPI